MSSPAVPAKRPGTCRGKENGESKNASEIPVTGDGIACAVALFTAASLGIAAMPISNKKK